MDAGLVVNPDGLKNQIEGGIVQAASWTLKEQVRWTRDGIALHVSSGERGKLICLTAYARKAHFHYHQEAHVYLLDLLKEIVVH